LQRLKDPNEINGDNLYNTRSKDQQTLRDEKEEMFERQN
jgi:hypothetical protein